MRTIPERDWKVLRELKPLALERFCERVLAETTQVANDKNLNFYDRYSKLFLLMRDQDKELAAAFDELRRSTALIQLMKMHSLGLFTEEQFARFSEETRQLVQLFAKR